TTDYVRPYNDGISDGFVMKLDAAGSRMLYSTYIGGAEEDTPFGIALGSNNLCIIRLTTPLDFSATKAVQPIYGGGRGDVFVLKIADGPPAPLLARIFSAASFIGQVSSTSSQGPVAPESIATIFGAGLASETVIAPPGPLPTSLGDVSV